MAWSRLTCSNRIIVIAVCLILALAMLCGGFDFIGRIVSAQAMRSVAEKLGTEPHITAINKYVTQTLEEHLGASQDDIHTILAEIGDFSYVPSEARPGEKAREDAWWTVAGTLWWEYVSGWTLVYDIDGRLKEVMRIDI